MTPDGTAAPSRWADACLAARLLAIDPAGLGGARLRACAGPVRERWLAELRAHLPEDAPVRRVPLGIAEGRLLGGLDLAATLRAGRPVAEAGLLAEADGGLVVLAMAERIGAGAAAQLAAALDRGEVATERDGFSLRRRARFGVVALDEGGEDEAPPASLTDRMALHLDLDGIAVGQAEPTVADVPACAAARERLAGTEAGDDLLAALCAAAFELGIASLRAPLLALATARVSAALAGRAVASAEDAALAARLVLAPRATRLPAAEEAGAPEDGAEEAAPPPRSDDEASDEAVPGEVRPLDDVVLEAAAAAIPTGLLAALLPGASPSRRPAGPGGSGVRRRAKLRGRPAGVRRGELRDGARLNLVETLRAAAPWQPLRRRDGAGGPRVVVRPDDIRVSRFTERSETTTIFVVDASGSAAAHRLAEAKGAVELLLADCYARRDRVALIAFRGTTAELLLPPTRSLTRARRGLAGLPGGGGTPLAAAIDAAGALGDVIRRRGGTPLAVFLTDGRANVGRDGGPGRERALEEALAAGRMLRAEGGRVLFVDTSLRPNDTARRVAEAMAARYLPLPSADAVALNRMVRAMGPEAGMGGR